jgi:hypothetical protein
MIPSGERAHATLWTTLEPVTPAFPSRMEGLLGSSIDVFISELTLCVVTKCPAGREQNLGVHWSIRDAKTKCLARNPTHKHLFVQHVTCNMSGLHNTREQTQIKFALFSRGLGAFHVTLNWGFAFVLYTSRARGTEVPRYESRLGVRLYWVVFVPFLRSSKREPW